VASFRIGFNEGSLLRRTLLHVGTFVLGSVAFIGLMSLVLTSVAKGLVAPKAETTAKEDEAAEAAPAATAAPATRPPKATRPARGRRAAPAPAPAAPAKDD
jgi:hypothetical protein